MGAVVAGAGVGALADGIVVAVAVVLVWLAVEPNGLVRFELRPTATGVNEDALDDSWYDCDCGSGSGCDIDCDRWAEFSAPAGAAW